MDDNKDSASTLAAVLDDGSHTIRYCHDGLECIRLAEDFKPDVALIDLGLPRATGYDVARAIRNMSFGNHVLIIAITAYGSDEHRRKAKEAGFDFHILKPANIDQLKALILGNRQTRP